MRVNREAWIKKGIEILKKQGYLQVTMERLCREMGKTKGSFYHHFKDHREFLGALLSHCEKHYSLALIDRINEEKDSLARLDRMNKVLLDLDIKLEQALRLWSYQDTGAKKVMKRIDDQRKDSVRKALLEMGSGKKKAETFVQIIAALYIGVVMQHPKTTIKDFIRLSSELDRNYLPALLKT